MPMEFIETPLQGLYVIKPRILKDDRGLFTRTFCSNEFAQIGFSQNFVQFNESVNLNKGTVRGMHYQNTPFSDAKLIRCTQGKVWDVIIDIRKNSATFLQYYSVELSSDNKLSVFIPEGFAHGFQTLEDNSTIIYHHTQYYAPDSEGGINFSDPLIGIKWPAEPVKMSSKDLTYRFINNDFKGIDI
ncbi:dTDP-4-dehydrorhamnose 3,5-epimerase [soil metagenome]